jgi:hypothetical protein
MIFGGRLVTKEGRSNALLKKLKLNQDGVRKIIYIVGLRFIIFTGCLNEVTLQLMDWPDIQRKLNHLLPHWLTGSSLLQASSSREDAFPDKSIPIAQHSSLTLEVKSGLSFSRRWINSMLKEVVDDVANHLRLTV